MTSLLTETISSVRCPHGLQCCVLELLPAAEAWLELWKGSCLRHSPGLSSVPTVWLWRVW